MSLVDYMVVDVLPPLHDPARLSTIAVRWRAMRGTLRTLSTKNLFVPHAQVSLIYFQLGREDHRWWWRSFFSGGSTGLFVYAYSFFYFFNRSQMDGLLQVQCRMQQVKCFWRGSAGVAIAVAVVVGM